MQRSRATGGEATTGRHTANIGSELAKLADACKGGQRQQFLISARAISTFVRALSVGTAFSLPRIHTADRVRVRTRVE
jgi:hypothetical protein